ncbi:MAG TPA: folylpolyglutamate synthase/dihydrofolate synthase family protein [Syntrophorhabdaceae bacterium]
MKGLSGALEYLNVLEKNGTVFGLANIEWILDLLDNPEKSLKTVHIAGTNGKGSVASILSSILQEEGYKVGKYTSPHLLSFTERIAIDGIEISEKEVEAITDEIREKVQRADKNRFFTFFDFTTAMALLHFSRKGAEISVIETGLGGRLDSTNVVRPLVSVITNVDYDHTDYLGKELENIAREKAGIIKEGVPVVTGAGGIPLSVIERIAGELGSPVAALGRDFAFRKVRDGQMTYEGLGMRLEEVRVNLRGDHQLANGALALCTCEYLSRSGFPISETSMTQGASRVEWPGRLEVVREKPTVLLDGAHNPHGIRALKEYVAGRYEGIKKILVFGVMRDKEYEVMLRELTGSFQEIVLTRPLIERALPPGSLEVHAPGAHVTATVE